MSQNRTKPKATLKEKLADLVDTKNIEEHQIRTSAGVDAFFHSMAESMKKDALARNKKQE